MEYFFHPFAFNYPIFIYKAYHSCIFYSVWQLLNIRVFKPFTLNLVLNMTGFKSTIMLLSISPISLFFRVLLELAICIAFYLFLLAIIYTFVSFLVTLEFTILLFTLSESTFKWYCTTSHILIIVYFHFIISSFISFMYFYKLYKFINALLLVLP